MRTGVVGVALCLLGLHATAFAAPGDAEFAQLLSEIPTQSIEILPNMHPGDPGFDKLPPQLQIDLRNVDDMEQQDANNQSPWIPQWIPDGKPFLPDSPGCDTTHLLSFFTSSGVDHNLIPFWQKCVPQYAKLVVNRLEPLVRLLGEQYNVLNHPYIRRVMVKTVEGEKIKGFLALQPTLEPRPLVIVRCGLVCNATTRSPMLLEMLMHYYDEGPYHVLLLGNGTGTAFPRDNHYFLIGGVEDGRLLSQVVRIFRDPRSALSQHISSIHVVGVSLGGQGTLYSDLYESTRHDGPGIQSATAVCPVVNLQPSINALFASTQLEATFIIDPLWSLLSSAEPDIPDYQKYFPTTEPTHAQFPAVIGNAMLQWYKEWKARFDWSFTPFAHVKITSLAQTWQINQFQPRDSQITIPTLLLAADDDQIVDPKQNTEALISAWGSNFHGPQTALMTTTGNHCGFATSLGWNNYSTLVRAFIESQSPELDRVWHTVLSPQGINWGQLKLRPGQQYYDEIWSLKPDSYVATLTFKIWDPQADPSCNVSDPSGLGDKCFYDISVPVDTRLLNFPAEKFIYDHAWGEVETEALTRWMNNHVRVLNQQQQRLKSVLDWPTWIQWDEVQ